MLAEVEEVVEVVAPPEVGDEGKSITEPGDDPESRLWGSRGGRGVEAGAGEDGGAHTGQARATPACSSAPVSSSEEEAT